MKLDIKDKTKHTDFRFKKSRLLRIIHGLEANNTQFKDVFGLDKIFIYYR
jgi:hypothetical protein